MAQPLQSINLVAPGFKGINTEDSPIAQDPAFAEKAENTVIDKSGRIAARQGAKVITEDRSELAYRSTKSTDTSEQHIDGTYDWLHKIHYYYDSLGNEEVFSTANNKILKGTTSLVDITPAGYQITANNWKIVNFNSKAYFFQRGHDPLVYDVDNGLRTFTEVNGEATPPEIMAHECAAGYGRLWIADNTLEKQRIYWSDLLIGNDFTDIDGVVDGTGFIDIGTVWPDGFDEIKAITVHNDLLIIFGKHSIVAYSGATDPSTMVLADTVAGVGCICRNSVQSIGTDVLFMSDDGLRSFGRTIQEKSLPISDLSANVKTDLIRALGNRTRPTASVYSPEQAFYLISFPEQDIVYCFDLKVRLENNSYRVTTWTGEYFKSFERKLDGTILMGSIEGISEYKDYADGGKSYRFKYYSPALAFGDASKFKFLKKLNPTIVGGSTSTVFVKWGYDFTENYSSLKLDISQSDPAFYGEALYGTSPDSNGAVFQEAQYTTGRGQVFRPRVNCSGSGTLVTVGLEADIGGSALSLQEINVLALIGRTL